MDTIHLLGWWVVAVLWSPPSRIFGRSEQHCPALSLFACPGQVCKWLARSDGGHDHARQLACLLKHVDAIQVIEMKPADVQRLLRTGLQFEGVRNRDVEAVDVDVSGLGRRG